MIRFTDWLLTAVLALLIMVALAAFETTATRSVPDPEQALIEALAEWVYQEDVP